jgi:hypothetical protein
MPKLFSLLLLVITAISSFAQEDTSHYSQNDKLQNEIWTNAPSQFRVSDIPREMNNESAVIIARSIVVTNSTDKKLLSGLQTSPVISDRAVWHERVKINDKAALERYSSTTYTKEFNRTFLYQSGKVHDTMRNYFGAKVIKPDGTETIVNNKEEVITKNERNEQRAKIAFSGLQAGDILDYYIVSEVIQQARGNVRGPYTFFLQYDYPILYYYTKFQFDSETGVEYINANGAPNLKQSLNENGDIILGLALKNLPKIGDSLFASPLRQYPYIRLQFKFVGKGEDLYTHFKRGVVKHGALTDDLLQQLKQMYRFRATSSNGSPVNKIKNYFGEVLKIKDVSADDIIKELYDDFRYTTFCYFPDDDIDVSNDINYRYANSLNNAIYFSGVINQLGIPNTLYLVCSRYSNSLNDVMNISDFDALIKVSGSHEHWVSFDDVVTQLNEIPARLQGEEAITFAVEKSSSTYAMEKSRLPITSPSDNEVSENIVVSFDSADMQSLVIDRNCKQTGALRHAAQKKLLLIEDMEAILAKPLTQKNQMERLNYKRKNENVAEEYLTAFAKERTNSKTYFIDEITDHFNNAPKELKAYKIVEPAIMDTSFEYEGTFKMENLVKKAGDNFILEAGILIGSYNKIDERNRNRRISIFMLCPRIYTWDITINIPKGYKVRGVENFNKELKNETGSFNCTVQSDNNKVEIKTALTYYHNFEDAANWNKLAELMDAMYNLSTQKLLFEKAKL